MVPMTEELIDNQDWLGGYKGYQHDKPCPWGNESARLGWIAAKRDQVTKWAEQAEQYQNQADRAFGKYDRLVDQGKDRAAVRTIHEARRLQALADQYRALATPDGLA